MAHFNKKVAKNRGESWKSNLRKGKLETRLNPTKLTVSRIRANYSQDLMANSLGLARNTYGAIERGQRPVLKNRALKISKLLNIPLKNLFKIQSKKTQKYIARK